MPRRAVNNTKDLVGTRCAEGSKFETNQSTLTEVFVKESLKEALAAKSWVSTRQDHMYRVTLLEKYLSGEITQIPCMSFPVDGQMSEEMRWMSSLRPPCKGNKFVRFRKFNEIMCGCDDQLEKRFREFVISGMCNHCQAWYIERDME